MLPDFNIRSWRDIFTGEQLEMFFPVSKPEKTGGTHIKVTVMLFVSLLGLNCRFWSHLGCLGWKVLYLPIQVSLSTRHKEIFKKECPDTDHRGGGGYSYEFLLGVCRPVLHILTLFQIKTCHTRFQTWPLKSIPVFRLGIGRNYVIIYNKIKTLTKRFLTIHFEFAYYSFFHFHLELKRQIRSCTPVFYNQNQNGAKRSKNRAVWGDTCL